MGFIISLIIAFVIGWIGNKLTKHEMPGGIIGSVIAGFVGAWIGQGLLGTWGPDLGGFAIIPAVIGAVIFIFLIGLISRSRKK
ncbi:GlsB/YeaQ/YmgE family stress response membrane protein [Bacillus lacus]|uniref:GlsB/YeaQ/YmgE family stress response membrane protein n=1 Tax=Metabacillus lacus TaxID=1983721 RepID=A0A7X2LYZ6_9BACI|nr:GlsB/YeaQ/YmgE family stress response membrane protein [Metabacillus lacus]MRX71149.1 GlsB/YeaQ/YmgE family stress response membrane protein [Metabacillus lacus]